MYKGKGVRRYFYPPPREDSQGDIKICPCLSPSVRPFVTLYGINLCNQLLPQFSVDLSETLHICYEHIEDVHMGF